MPEKDTQRPAMRLPQGFTVYSSKRSSEYAREQGWGINEEERKKKPQQTQDDDGGLEDDDGARDIGARPVETASAKAAADPRRKQPIWDRKHAA